MDKTINSSQLDGTTADNLTPSDKMAPTIISEHGNPKHDSGGPLEKTSATQTCTCIDKRKDKQTIRSIWQNFASITTLHGVVQIQQNNVSIEKRIFWCLLFLGMTTGLGYVLINLLITYREYPFTSVWTLRRMTLVDAPTVTLCPSNVYNLTKARQSSGEAKRYFDWLLRDNHNDIEHQPFNITYSSLVDSFGLSVESVVRDAWFMSGEKMLTRGKELVTRHYFHNTLCFTVNHFRDKNQTDTMSTQDHFHIFIDLPKDSVSKHAYQFGLDLYLYKKGTTMSGITPILISPGFKTSVLFTQTKFVFLPLPYKSFGSFGCLDLSDGDSVNSLKTYPIYTRDNCITELLEEMSSERCGCVGMAYTEIFQKEECTVDQVESCVTPLKVKENLSQSYHFHKECPYACNDTVFDYSSSIMLYDPNPTRNSTTCRDQESIHLVLSARTSKIETMTHVPEKTLVEILAQIGGYLGLFLGASVMTAAELVQVLMTSIKHCIMCRIRE